ncbi:MAG TPA: DNA polymerase/3'-5' exonuclease PolX [Gemmatimonadaceae bacterium]
MDSRTAAHVLTRIAAYLELKGESSFKVRAYEGAARSVRALNSLDLAPLLQSGELAQIRGLGPATLAVLRDLIETGESRYLEQLRQSTPEGLIELLDVPGLTPARIHGIYETLNIRTIEDLEAAAKNGRLATVPKLGPKTAERILKGIAMVRARGSRRLYSQAAPEAARILDAIRAHPDIERAELSGDVRRRMETISTIDIVAACRADPVTVAQFFTRIAGVSATEGDGAAVSILFVDGTRLDLRCVEPSQFGVAWWLATGSESHVDEVTGRLASNGVSVRDDTLVDASGRLVPAPDEDVVYRAAGLVFTPPELREGRGEVDAASRDALPNLITAADIQGVLHCHTLYSDGTTSVADIAKGARERGWSYIGITDHSQASGFAGGMSREKVLAQHEEIDALNTELTDIRVLKGVEADILADGQLDYGDELLDSFDFVIGSVHSRFSMDGPAMTDRILRAMDDPRLTILGHPTGRKLLSRESYALDVEAVLQKAAEVGAAIELNADPHRLDLDWRYLRRAKELGVTIEIGPDAHSIGNLDYMNVGLGMARKGWLERSDVLNTRSVDDILGFARARRASH